MYQSYLNENMPMMSFEDHHQFLPNIKLEPDFENYFPISIDLNTTKMATLQTVRQSNPTPSRQINFETSDGEASPISMDENDVIKSNFKTKYVAPGKISKRKSSSNKSRKLKGDSCGQNRSRLSTTSSESSIPKEKDRARLFNEAFDGLRRRIPSIPSNKKLSKIEILRLAICYLSYLKHITDDSKQFENNTTTTENDADVSNESDDVIVAPECSTQRQNQQDSNLLQSNEILLCSPPKEQQYILQK